MEMQPPRVNEDMVAEWWRLAISSFNQQVGKMFADNPSELKKFLEEMVEQMEMKVDDVAEIMGEDKAHDALENAKESLMEDPGFLLLGKWVAEMMPNFLSHLGDGDFTEIPGTKIEIFAVRSDNDGLIRGCDIKRSPVSDDEINVIAANGMAAVEDFLKTINPTEGS